MFQASRIQLRILHVTVNACTCYRVDVLGPGSRVTWKAHPSGRLEKERRLQTAGRIHHCDTARNVPALYSGGYVNLTHTHLILYPFAIHSTKLLSRCYENMVLLVTVPKLCARIAVTIMSIRGYCAEFLNLFPIASHRSFYQRIAVPPQ
jgi:hypothetical protein